MVDLGDSQFGSSGLSMFLSFVSQEKLSALDFMPNEMVRSSSCFQMNGGKNLKSVMSGLTV